MIYSVEVDVSQTWIHNSHPEELGVTIKVFILFVISIEEMTVA